MRDHNSIRAKGGKRILNPNEFKKSSPKNPLVSIATVTYNSEKTLQRTIDSVKQQTYTNIEYIIIDGASTDGTLEVINENLDVIDYFVSEPDKGIYDAMNKGIKIASGDYIMLLNSDDWYEERAVEELLEVVTRPGCDFAGALARYINNDETSHVLPSMAFDSSTLLRMPLRHQTLLVPRWIYQQVGLYDQQYSIIADHEFAIRLFLSGLKYKELDTPLLNFSTSGVSNTNWKTLHSEQIKLLSSTFPNLSNEEAERIGNHSTARPSDFVAVCSKHTDDEQLLTASQLLLDEFSRLWRGHWQKEHIIIKNALKAYSSPQISIIIPMHNSASTIEEAIQSCQNQSYSNIEVICIDDCSSDATPEIAQRIESHDSRVKVIREKTNKGPGASRNIGLKLAQGDYIFFLDADDLIPPNAIECLLSKCIQERCDMARGAFKISRNIFDTAQHGIKYVGGLKQGDEPIVLSGPSKYRALETTEGHWACLYSKRLIINNQYPEDIMIGEDSLFLIKAITNSQSILVISDVVYEYRDARLSTMNNYTYPKLIDEVKWRIAAWHILNKHSPDKATYFAFHYWNPWVRQNLQQIASPHEAANLNKVINDFIDSIDNYCDNQDSELHQLKIACQNLAKRDVELPSAQKKILILNALADGGAAIAAWRMLKAFRHFGHDAFGISIRKKESNYVFQAYFNHELHPALTGSPSAEDVWNTWKSEVVVSNATARELFSMDSGLANTEKLREIVESVDIVYLHWHTGLLSIQDLPHILNGKPLVWIFHDMRPMTGGCHYSEGCLQYEKNCDDCPMMPQLERRSVAITLQRQKDAVKNIKNMHIVCPSDWLASKAAKSTIFKGLKISCIPNFTDLKNFYFRDKIACRTRLGLSTKKKLILFGADSLSNSRKGINFLIESLSLLKQEGKLENVELACFGSSRIEAGFYINHFGKISDHENLAMLYSACDVFAFPSLEENAPQVVVEAQLSGCPVVCFPVGNTESLIKNGVTGYISQYESASDMATGIHTLLAKLDKLSKSDEWRYKFQISRRMKALCNGDSIIAEHNKLIKALTTK